MPSWPELEKRHSELAQIRAGEESIWRDLARMLEEDGGALNAGAGTARSRPDSFDSTPLYAKDDFVGGLFTEAINPADPWFELKLDDLDLQQWGPVARFLFDVRAFVLSSLDPAVSSFYTEMVPTFGELGKYGNGFLAQEEIPGRGRISERSLPVMDGDGGVYIDVDAFGDVTTIHRKFSFTGRQAQQKWGDAAPAMQEAERATFVHALYPNPAFVPGALGPRGMPVVSCYASPDKREFSLERGFYEMPIHPFQWQRRGGRPWAFGPGHKALADIGMADEMRRSTMIALQFEAEPMLLTHDDGVLSAADIVPSAIINGALNGQGKALLQRLDRGENLNLPMGAIQNVQRAVREAFKFSLFQVLNRPQMTGQEFLGWKEESLKILAPYLVSVHRGLASFITRRVALLARMHPERMPPVPPELANTSVKIGFVSPFAQAQKSSKARAALQLGGAAAQLQPIAPDIGDVLDADDIMRTIADGMTGDPRHVRDAREVAQRRSDRAAAQQSAATLQNAASASEVYANFAHAQQANTLAAGRTQGP